MGGHSAPIPEEIKSKPSWMMYMGDERRGLVPVVAFTPSSKKREVLKGE